MTDEELRKFRSAWEALHTGDAEVVQEISTYPPGSMGWHRQRTIRDAERTLSKLPRWMRRVASVIGWIRGRGRP